MHYHCEVVIPPTANIEAAVALAMRPFDENRDDEDADRSHAFWDFFVIGGRWAGHKLMAAYDPEKIEAFHDWMIAEHVTVSGLQCGKQQLSPASQIAKVDAKWNEMFPSETFVACPIFKHSNDQYGKEGRGTLPDDVCELRRVPERLTCSRVIFAGPSWTKDKQWTGPIVPTFMLCDEQWNGVNHMKIDWDGKFASALAKFRADIGKCGSEYAQAIAPQDDWLAVTVDYHS